MEQEKITTLIKSINWYLDRKRDFNSEVFEDWKTKHQELTGEIKTLTGKQDLLLTHLPEIIGNSLDGLVKAKVELNLQVKRFLSQYEEVEELSGDQLMEKIRSAVLPNVATAARVAAQQGTNTAPVTRENHISPAIGAQLNVEAFSGPEDDVEQWFKNYERQANAYFWNDEIKLAKLPIYLKEAALSAFENIQEGKKIRRSKKHANRRI